MNSIKRCTECAGQKQVLSLGGLFKKCMSCKGVGYAERVADADVDKFLEEKPKKTRKPRVEKLPKLQAEEVAHVTSE